MKLADDRDVLAVDRTILAAERTYAAWLRTGLAALASGAGAHSLLKGVLIEPLPQVAATLLIFCAVLCFGAGLWRELTARMAWQNSDVPRMARFVLFVTSGALSFVCAVVVAGVWMLL